MTAIAQIPVQVRVLWPEQRTLVLSLLLLSIDT